MSTEAEQVDGLLYGLETALKEVENAKGVRLEVIEKEMQNKLKQLKDLLMFEMLQGSMTHTRVLHVFGGDHSRIGRIHDVLERVMYLYSCKAEEQETQPCIQAVREDEEQESHASMCLQACRSVEAILGIKLGDKRRLSMGKDVSRRTSYESKGSATPRRNCSGETDGNIHSLDGQLPPAVGSVSPSMPGRVSIRSDETRAEYDESGCAFTLRNISGEIGCTAHSVDGQLPAVVGCASSSMPGHVSEQCQQSTWMQHTKHCEICTAGFGIFVRRHHCRSCGRNVCNACSPFRVRLTSPLLHPSKDDFGPHRVCVGCHEAGNSNTNNANA